MNPTPSFRQLLTNPVHLLAFGFGTGLSPRAPGTAGTLVGIPLFLLIANQPLWLYGLLVAVGFAVGVYLCGRTARDLGVHDHGGIVWDEIIGFLITMTAVPPHWWWLLLGFGLFRLFDIWKPWPIGWADRRMGGGTGIMVDDVLAGIYAGAVLQILIAFDLSV